MKKNYKLSVGDVKYIINRQEQLNIMYHGENWFNVLEVDGLRTCAMFEYIAEFCREIEGLWKHFGNCAINREEALFELVDSVSFICSSYNFENNLIWPTNEELNNLDVPQFTYTNKQTIRDIINNFTSILTDHEHVIYSPYVIELIAFTAVNLKLIDVSAEEFMIAYEKKAELNAYRAKNGATDGSYDKSKEQKLTITLSEPCKVLQRLINTSKGDTHE